MSKESIIAKIKEKADELTIKAEGLQEAIGEGGNETFSEEELFHMHAEMEQAYKKANFYNRILAKTNNN